MTLESVEGTELLEFKIEMLHNILCIVQLSVNCKYLTVLKCLRGQQSAGHGRTGSGQHNFRRLVGHGQHGFGFPK